MQYMKKINKGFTLVEMTIALVIGATLLTAGLKIAAIWAERAAISTTQKHQEAIKQALISYLGANGRLPCPDSVIPFNNIDSDERVAGCATIGIIPFITLGLYRGTITDGWDNYFTYMVSPTWLMTYDKNLAGADPLGQRTNNILLAFWAGASNGQITVYDRYPADADKITIGNPANGTGAAVAIVSHGRNGLGSYNINLVKSDNPPANTDELINVNPVPVFAVFKHQWNEVAATAGGVYDDVVLTLNANELIEPLINNGTYRNTTAQSVINEANDLYLAQVITSKGLCASPPFPCAVNFGYYYSMIVTGAPQAINGSDNARAWSASYDVPNNALIDTVTNSNAAAYSISVNGSTKTYTINELKANLARMSGF
jgi:prepilin-type N-terminal cleavage/methylation domain-containing protein